MILDLDGSQYDLGAVSAMPLSVDGTAVYNVANLAGAALAAAALGIAPATIASVFTRFGSSPGDNPGRLMRFDVEGVKVLIDYAHNSEGLRVFSGWRITCEQAPAGSDFCSGMRATAKMPTSENWPK